MSETAILPPPEALAPARELAAASKTRWAGESAEYRKARIALLEEEIALRRQIERVAQHRRALPPGPEAKNYRFLDEQGREVGLTDLFGEHDALLTYLWMYGPERKRPCPMCTSFVGSLDIPAPDIEQRLSLAIIGRSPVARQLAFARERGWQNLKFYQTVGDDYGRDVHALTDQGEGAAPTVWRRACATGQRKKSRSGRPPGRTSSCGSCCWSRFIGRRRFWRAIRTTGPEFPGMRKGWIWS